MLRFLGYQSQGDKKHQRSGSALVLINEVNLRRARIVFSHSVSASYQFIMVTLWNRADHYIFALWFLLLLSSLFISSPNLSRRRLDACHTYTHGVALVRMCEFQMQV